MKKLMLIIFVCCLLMFLATCEKRTPLVEEQIDQPISVSVEVNGQQSYEVRIK